MLSPTSPRKQVQAATVTTNDIVPPLDYSFFSIQNVTEVLEEDPRPSVSSVHVKKSQSGKSEGRCLRLNNNTLNDCSSLMSVAESLFERPEDVAWIDLSFNGLTKIDPVLTNFKNMKILYLHSNSITDLKEVEKLGALPQLRKLSLHANPVDRQPGYRNLVLSYLPKLQCLDFSVVTKAERQTAANWYKMNIANKPKKPKMEGD